MCFRQRNLTCVHRQVIPLGGRRTVLCAPQDTPSTLVGSYAGIVMPEGALSLCEVHVFARKDADEEEGAAEL